MLMGLTRHSDGECKPYQFQLVKLWPFFTYLYLNVLKGLFSEIQERLGIFSSEIDFQVPDITYTSVTTYNL